MTLFSVTSGGEIVREYYFDASMSEVMRCFEQVIEGLDKSRLPPWASDFLALPVFTQKGRGWEFVVALSPLPIPVYLGQFEFVERNADACHGKLTLATSMPQDTSIPHENMGKAKSAQEWGRGVLTLLWQNAMDDWTARQAGRGAASAPSPANGAPQPPFVNFTGYVTPTGASAGIVQPSGLPVVVTPLLPTTAASPDGPTSSGVSGGEPKTFLATHSGEYVPMAGSPVRGADGQVYFIRSKREMDEEGRLATDFLYQQACGIPAASPAMPQPPADGQSGKLEKIAEKRILARGERVTEARLKREIEDIQIESMMDTHAPEMIASKLGMNEDTLVSRIKKLRSRQNSP